MIAILDTVTSARTRVCLLAMILSILAACGGGSGSGRSITEDAVGDSPPTNIPTLPPTSPTTPIPPNDPPPPPDKGMVQGFVIDGPVAGADVVVIDAKGAELARVTTDSDARFLTAIPADAVYPLAVTASGGVNMTTGSAPDVLLRGVIGAEDEQHVVVSALSTLVITWAECTAVARQVTAAEGVQSLIGDPEQSALFLADHGFGLTPDQHARLLGGQPASAEGAVRLLLASEALVETLRRASSALHEEGVPTTANDLLRSVACGTEDALQAGQTNGDSATHAQRMAAFHSAATAVNVEASSGLMRIASLEQDVTSMLEQAVIDTFGFARSASFDDLPLGGGFLAALQSNVYAMLAWAPSAELFDLYADLLTIDPDAPRGEIKAIIAKASKLEPKFRQLLLEVAGDSTIAEDFLTVVEVDTASMPPPHIVFDATPRKIPTRGGSTAISYTAEHAQVCRRMDGEASVWSGVSGPSAQFESGPINQVSTLRLSCAGPGGIAETSVDVTVPPAVNIRFSSTSEEPSHFTALGDLLRVEIEVVDGAKENCQLIRSDTGANMASGDTVIAGPGINLEASCEGPGGVAVTAMSLPVRAARLRWIPPTETEDDEPLALKDIAGYRIYHGTTSGHYDEPVISIGDPERTEFIDSFPAGTRYFVMTAMSTQGVESRLSNEVIRDIP